MEEKQQKKKQEKEKEDLELRKRKERREWKPEGIGERHAAVKCSLL